LIRRISSSTKSPLLSNNVFSSFYHIILRRVLLEWIWPVNRNHVREQGFSDEFQSLRSQYADNSTSVIYPFDEPLLEKYGLRRYPPLAAEVWISNCIGKKFHGRRGIEDRKPSHQSKTQTRHL
jgi:hypothetical protein